jgi:hypothetical protein
MECLECGVAFQPKKPHAEFCCESCRKAWHNRRMKRGAEIYDVVMTMRYNRDYAQKKGLTVLLVDLISAYQAADKVNRQGRRSYDKKAHKRLPLSYGKSGDGR